MAALGALSSDECLLSASYHSGTSRMPVKLAQSVFILARAMGRPSEWGGRKACPTNAGCGCIIEPRALAIVALPMIGSSAIPRVAGSLRQTWPRSSSQSDPAFWGLRDLSRHGGHEV